MYELTYILGATAPLSTIFDIRKPQQILCGFLSGRLLFTNIVTNVSQFRNSDYRIFNPLIFFSFFSNEIADNLMALL